VPKVDRHPKRTKLELAYMVAVTAVTFALAAALIIGVPALFVVRALDEGATIRGLIGGGLAAAWIGFVLQGVIRDAETRGWVAFLLIGWVFYIPSLLRRAIDATRR
jgi:hypothetical protein